MVRFGKYCRTVGYKKRARWTGGEVERRGGGEAEKPAVGFGELMLQGVATAIDALSVGFTIADYGWAEALISSLIIGLVTFVICIGGLRIGRAFGTKLSDKAQILGGAILIFIGVKIFFGF